MPGATIPPSSTSDIELPKLKATSRRGTHSDVKAESVASDTYMLPYKEFIYETPKREISLRMMMMIMTMSFSRRTQRRLVEKTWGL